MGFLLPNDLLECFRNFDVAVTGLSNHKVEENNVCNDDSDYPEDPEEVALLLGKSFRCFD